MNSDQYAAAYAEIKNKIRWALQTTFHANYSFSDAMDWAAQYATDALDQWKLMEETPDYRPYTSRRRVHQVNGRTDSTEG